MHESVRRIESWLVFEEHTLPIVPTMAFADLHSHGERRPLTRISYADGRCFDVTASRRSIFRALLGNDDAVTFKATIGIPRELPTKGES